MILCGGNSLSFSNLLIENGAKEMTFLMGQNMIPVLEEKQLSFLLLDGKITSRISTSEAEEHQFFAVAPGTILPKFPNCFHCKITPFEILMPIDTDARCLVIPSSKLYELKTTHPDLSLSIDRDAYSVISYLAVSSIAFHSGNGITRVASFIYCHYGIDHYVEFTQDEIAAATNLSLSQVWRSLKVLQNEGAVVTSYGHLKIEKIEELEKFVHDLAREFPCFTHN